MNPDQIDALGSSPRMRGARRRGRGGALRSGIIPAYAGSTSPAPRRARPSARDHPRVCGEHGSAPSPMYRRMGPSPRMRGARVHEVRGGLADGIIPAYAGSTPACRAGGRWCRDHPRVCGEHGGAAEYKGSHWGSSPRMRGALLSNRGISADLGIIPAYAGSTGSYTCFASASGDHPRVCGEHLSLRSPVRVMLGSSPRMRGARLGLQVRQAQQGIIPAYAGSTCAARVPYRYRRDHPRVCGEHLAIILDSRSNVGSSPRMRGARNANTFESVAMGIIPAYAGSTHLYSGMDTTKGDHPRVCGEH